MQLRVTAKEVMGSRTFSIKALQIFKEEIAFRENTIQFREIEVTIFWEEVLNMKYKWTAISLFCQDEHWYVLQRAVVLLIGKMH